MPRGRAAGVEASEAEAEGVVVEGELVVVVVVDGGRELEKEEGLEMPRNLRSKPTDPDAEYCDERERFDEWEAYISG
jgi:hypothetical protein